MKRLIMVNTRPEKDNENTFFFDESKARFYAREVDKLLNKIVGDYEYVAVNLDDMSEDGEEGFSFQIMFGNELIYRIDIVETYKNLKNNDNFRVKNEKDEDYLFSLIPRKPIFANTKKVTSGKRLMKGWVHNKLNIEAGDYVHVFPANSNYEPGLKVITMDDFDLYFNDEYGFPDEDIEIIQNMRSGEVYSGDSNGGLIIKI